MTKYHARDEADLGCIEGNSAFDRSTEGFEVSQVPKLISLAESATIASQRATQKKALPSQAKRPRAVSWRRLLIGKMLVISFLVVLTGVTYWGLSGGNGSFALPSVQQTTVHQIGDGEKDVLDSVEMTSFPDFPTEEERAVMARPPVITDKAIPSRVTLGQVIVQPELPVLTARRLVKPGEELPGGELRRDARTAR